MKCDILSVYGQVKINQNICRKCNRRFFILSEKDNDLYCSDCRTEIMEQKKESDNTLIIYHTPLHKRFRISRKIRLAVYERDNYKCVYCNKDLYDDFKYKTGQIALDHFVPYIGRGDDRISNLYTTCRKCNVAKYSKLFNSVEEVREHLKLKGKIKNEKNTD